MCLCKCLQKGLVSQTQIWLSHAHPREQCIYRHGDQSLGRSLSIHETRSMFGERNKGSGQNSSYLKKAETV